MIKKIGSDYGHKLENCILECYSDNKRRDDLRKCISAYCAHLVNIGYSKQYLLKSIEDRFFTDDIGKIEKRTLQRFFYSLSKEDKQFRVWVSAPVTSANFIGKLNLEGCETKAVKALPVDVREAFQARSDYSLANRYITKCVPAKDKYSAASTMHQLLASIDSLLILGRESIEIQWEGDVYIRTPQATSGDFISGDLLSNLGPSQPVRGNTARAFRAQATEALTSFDPASTERLMSAVNTAALVRTSPNVENHLISLWSAIEVLLSNPPAGTPRIIHYVDLLAPCICARYVRRYIIAVHDAIKASYGPRYARLIQQMPFAKEVDEYTRFTHIAFDPAYKTQQTEMLNLLSDNPLALHRLWKLEKNFGTPKAYSKSVEDHEKRVRWQLHRIYRARNQLVHAGAVPVYLEPLVLNMLEYFRSTIGPIISRASKEDEPSEIDQMVTEIRMQFEILKRKTNDYKKDKFDPEDFSVFFKYS